MSTTSRQTIKTVGIWELQRREFDNDVHDYIIKTDGKPAVNLFVNETPDFVVEYTARSLPMNLEEAAAFMKHAQEALDVAVAFQQAIDEAESN